MTQNNLSRKGIFRSLVVVGIALGIGNLSIRPLSAGDHKTPSEVSKEVDRLILEQLKQAKVMPSSLTSDEDFLRRVTFDFAGKLPAPEEVTRFGLDPNPNKRSKLVKQLLNRNDFAVNWSRYWRDVIYSRATDQRARISLPTFESWMTEQLKTNQGWDQVVTEMITATGDIRENGATGFIFAHFGSAVEVAAETSRIFMGIQLQCANCHDHPTDSWKREQFHQLAAYFPRTRVRRNRKKTPRSFEVFSVKVNRKQRRGLDITQLLRRFDKNKDKQIALSELKGARFARNFRKILNRFDENKDNKLNMKELKRWQQTSNRFRGQAEYRMPDLKNPAQPGKRVDPIFFVNKEAAPQGLSDLERRRELAEQITSPENPWFSKAYVNRIWAEMLGEGFYMPIDDIGPERSAAYPKVMDYLAKGFTESGYNVKWLFEVIANTKTYQRSSYLNDPTKEELTFATAKPTKLRADQIYNAIVQILSVNQARNFAGNRQQQANRRRQATRGRQGFSLTFAYDPSTSQDDLTGDIPQALFMMNQPQIQNLMRGTGNTKLARILRKHQDDSAAISEVYLMVLAREPSKKELKTCESYLKKVNNRVEAFEDLLWSLMNSSEFLTKR